MTGMGLRPTLDILRTCGPYTLLRTAGISGSPLNGLRNHFHDGVKAAHSSENRCTSNTTCDDLEHDWWQKYQTTRLTGTLLPQATGDESGHMVLPGRCSTSTKANISKVIIADQASSLLETLKSLVDPQTLNFLPEAPTRIPN